MAPKTCSSALLYTRYKNHSTWRMNSTPIFPKSLFPVHSLILLQVGLLAAAIKYKVLLISCIYGPVPSSCWFQIQKKNCTARSWLVLAAGKASAKSSPPVFDGKLLQMKLFGNRNGNREVSFYRMFVLAHNVMRCDEIGWGVQQELELNLILVFPEWSTV